MTGEAPEDDDLVLPQDLKISQRRQIKFALRYWFLLAVGFALVGLIPAIQGIGLAEGLTPAQRAFGLIGFSIVAPLVVMGACFLIMLGFYPFLRRSRISRKDAERLFPD